MHSASRLLGLAFASADALIEIGADGTVTFCAGAGPDPATPVEVWRGRPLAGLLDVEGGEALTRALGDLAPGVRSRPLSVLFACGWGRARRGVLHAFRLAELAPATSCAVIWEGEPFVADLTAATPLATPDQFMDRARAVLHRDGAHGPVDLAFVDMPGLSAIRGPLQARVEAALQSASLEGRSAARLSEERFALFRGASVADLPALMRAAAAAEGAEVEPRVVDMSVAAGERPLNALRALRFTIEACLRDDAPLDPQSAFDGHLKRTLRDAERFTETVKTRRFDLHWQPIVDLSARAVHHFEGLARFGPEGGPAPIIRMAEELGLIEAFDLAVAEKAIGRLRRPGGGTLTLAINASALSLSSDAYVQALLRMTQSDPTVRRRLLVEVTETATLADLEAADKRLSCLRAAGVRVCIDDFGAGAASFEWLGGLQVDMIKIDGSLVNRLGSDGRASTLMAHLASLCRSLKIDVVAEKIETEEVAKTLRGLGVKYGQGWLFGRAEAEPVLRLQEPRIKRVGAVEAWG